MLYQNHDLKDKNSPDFIVNRAFEGRPDWTLMATLSRALKALDAKEKAVLEELAVGYNLGKFEATLDPWTREFKWRLARKN
jgi:hypothetical protein